AIRDGHITAHDAALVPLATHGKSSFGRVLGCQRVPAWGWAWTRRRLRRALQFHDWSTTFERPDDEPEGAFACRGTVPVVDRVYVQAAEPLASVGEHVASCGLAGTGGTGRISTVTGNAERPTPVASLACTVKDWSVPTAPGPSTLGAMASASAGGTGSDPA